MQVMQIVSWKSHHANHRLLKHINEEYNCKICNYSGNTEAHLKTHIEVKHSDYIYDCERWAELEAEKPRFGFTLIKNEHSRCRDKFSN